MARGLGQIGQGLYGATSWFGGPGDPSAGSKTASGEPTSRPGIATYDQSKVGGYWAIKVGNQVGIVKQTDVGPAPWTGRKFDFTYSLLPLLGYSTQTFPTGVQTFGYYLGKSSTAVSANLQPALAKLGTTPVQQEALMQSVDVGAIEQGHNAVFVGPHQAPGTTITDKGQATSGSSAVPSNIIPSPSVPGLDVAGALVNIWDSLTTPALWRRVLYFIGGGVLLFWGLKELTGAQIPAMKVAKAVAK